MSEITIKATASALDMCRDHGIEPAAVPCPPGALLTQPMVQAWRDRPAGQGDKKSDKSDKSDRSDLSDRSDGTLAESAPALTLVPPATKAKKKK